MIRNMGRTDSPEECVLKGVVITPDQKINIQEFERPLYRSVGTVVGGFIEIVSPGSFVPRTA